MNTTINELLDTAADIIKTNGHPTAQAWLSSYDAVVRTPRLAAENELLRARLYSILDAVRDLIVEGTDFPSEINDAYDNGAPIFGLPTVAEVERAEDAGDAAALAAFATQETLPAPLVPVTT